MKKLLLLLGVMIASVLHSHSVPEFYGSMKKANVGYADIAYYRFGHGKPLVLVTGHGDSMMMWHPEFLKKLSKNRELIIFDYPGIGDSTVKGNYPDSMARLSKLVYSFVENQKLDKPDILGFAMGGSLVLNMVSQNSNYYDHVIVVGAKAGGKQTVLPQKKYFDMLSNPKVPKAAVIKTLLFPVSAAKQADAYLKILSQLPPQKMDAAALKAQAEAVDRENNGEGILKQLVLIKNKIMVLSGTKDVLSPVQNAVMIADAIPGAWLIQIKDAGHGVLSQEPDYSADIIDLFLRY